MSSALSRFSSKHLARGGAGGSLSLLILGLVAALGASSPARAQTCYSPPFGNPDLADPWGCAAACGRSAPHRGLDYPEPCGTPIPAIADGVVVVNEYNGCLGNVVVLAHADGMFSGYNHMPARSPLALGSSVARGGIVGVVGNEGSCSMGCHLHLTVSFTAAGNASGYYADVQVDPYAYIQNHGTCDLLGEQSVAYAPPTTTDVDGDGRADMCARAADGVHCYLATGTGAGGGWTEADSVLAWSDASGWNAVSRYATLRMGDINGDGRADLCARRDDELICSLSTGTGLGPESVWRAGLTDASGWSTPEHYTTLRLADVDGDGREDLCARSVEGFGCWISDGGAFARRVEGPRWSNTAGFTREQYYGTLRMADLNGDGRADVCIRGAAGFSCALSDGNGFPTEFAGPPWSDASGFANTAYWSTARMGDVNGDGQADLCIRTSTDFRCAFSTGGGFTTAVVVAALSDASGWADPTNYRTFRLDDVNGDGIDDVCARANAGIVCHVWSGSAFVQRDGPAWSDAFGWAASGAYFDTLRLSDFDGDGSVDVCGRAGSGWRCNLTTVAGFGDTVVSTLLADAQGWNTSPRFWSTILSGGRCRARDEICNGRDDDCDGLIDEETCLDAGPSDAGSVATDADRADAGTRPERPIGAGCRCRATTRTAPLGTTLIVAATSFVVVARKRRVRSRRTR